MNATGSREETQTSTLERSTQPSRRGSLVAVVSGKGGVGKTNLATNLAVAAGALQARVLLVDGDLGLSNVDVLLGLVPRRTAAEVKDGECLFADAIVDGPRGIHVFPAGSARMDLAGSRPDQLGWLLGPLLEATSRYDLVLIDIGAGIGPAAISLASVCDLALLLTTSEPTSLTDAYATLKVLARAAPGLPVELVVNLVRDELQARDTHHRLELMARRFLDLPLALRGFLPRDPSVHAAVAQQQAVVEAYPTAPVSRRLVELAQTMLRNRTAVPDTGHGRSPRRPAWRRLES